MMRFEEYYDPKPTKFPFPEFTDQHYLVVKKNNGLVFNKDYPFIDKSKSFRFKKFWFRVFLICVLFPLTRIKLGLRIYGKKNLKAYRNVLKHGAVSICNHVDLWDFFAVKRALMPYNPNVLIWAPNVRGEYGGPMRLIGGIPIPESHENGFPRFLKDIGEHMKNGGWLHIYPEGSMWEFYKPIRPFKNGASYFACAHNKPVVPLAFSYRRASRLRKFIFKQPAAFNIHVGEPIFPNMDLGLKEREKDLLVRAHQKMCDLAGIDPKDNIYPPIFNNTRRVDYYTDKYGE